VLPWISTRPTASRQDAPSDRVGGLSEPFASHTKFLTLPSPVPANPYPRMSVTAPGRSHIIPGLHDTALERSETADRLHHSARAWSVAVDLVSAIVDRRSLAIFVGPPSPATGPSTLSSSPPGSQCGQAPFLCSQCTCWRCATPCADDPHPSSRCTSSSAHCTRRNAPCRYGIPDVTRHRGSARLENSPAQVRTPLHILIGRARLNFRPIDS